MRTAKFRVYGRPAPKGSWVFRRGKAHPSSRYLVKWQSAVQWSARASWDGLPLEKHVACGIRLKFFVNPSGKQWAGGKFPTKSPDLDKLVRAAVDALTGIVYVDDVQPVEIVASKVFAPSIDKAGCEVEVWEIDDRLRIQDV